MNMEWMPFQKSKKSPLAGEFEAARRAADIAAKEKGERIKKEQMEHGETKRLERLWLKEEASKAGPHVISEKDIAQSEEKVGRKFEKLN